MIRNIIFDLGGVLLNLDYSLTDKAFKELLGLNFTGRNYPKNYIYLFNNYEKGSLAEASFFYELQRLSSRNIEPSKLKFAWNKMLLDLPSERLAMLTRLKSSYRLILLSNTNHTHLTQFHASLHKKHNVVDFEDQYFHDVFYSYLIGMRKPDKEIYSHVLTSCDIKASETIFIEDTQENLVAPSDLGISCFLHPRNADIVNSIERYLEKGESSG